MASGLQTGNDGETVLDDIKVPGPNISNSNPGYIYVIQNKNFEKQKLKIL